MEKSRKRGGAGVKKSKRQAKEARARQLAKWIEEEFEKEPRTDDVSVRDKIKDVIEYPRWWMWRKLHYWVVAWQITEWYPKKRLKRNIPTRVCYTIRGVLQLPRGR